MKKKTFQQIRAACIGALVLGIGFTVTLASWTDQEYVQATFSTNIFGIEGAAKTPTVTFGEHQTEAHKIEMSLPVNAQQMIPGSEVYSGVLIRLIAGSDPGSVTLKSHNPASSAGIAAALRYGVSVLPNEQAECTANSFSSGQQIVGTSSAVLVPISTSATSSQNLLPGAEAIEPSTAIHYCFKFSLPANTSGAVMGTSVEANWTFEAVATNGS